MEDKAWHQSCGLGAMQLHPLDYNAKGLGPRKVVTLGAEPSEGTAPKPREPVMEAQCMEGLGGMGGGPLHAERPCGSSRPTRDSAAQPSLAQGPSLEPQDRPHEGANVPFPCGGN